jgi:hypothetical protein
MEKVTPDMWKQGQMAQRTQVILEDDLDGNRADQTIQFGIHGATYEIDLSEANVEKLDEALRPFISAGRKVSGGRNGSVSRRSAGATTKSDPEQLKAIREWAKANGQKVSDRGRISAEVVAAYEAAH